MAAPKLIEARFPLAGVVRRLAHIGDAAISEKPYTPWAVNVRPEDPFEHRRRGGSRPGILPYVLGEEPQWPVGELQDETGDPITDESGNMIHAASTGIPSLYPDITDAMEAYGYGELPDPLDSDEGTAPTDATIGVTYRNRLVLAGERTIYLSRQGNHGDWDYGAELGDTGRAFVYQLSEAGEHGETVTALIPHKDMFLIGATKYGLWVLKEDPVHEGSLRCVSRDVGIVSQTAWTKVGDTIVFLSWDGLYSMQADGSNLQSLSNDRLPVELRDVDPLNYPVRMGYQHNDGGVYVFIKNDQYHWFFDLEGGGFWPFDLPVVVEAAFIVDGQLVIKDSSDLLWTLDGEDDNGTDIQSHVLFGPLRATDAPHFFALLTSINGSVETEPDGAVTWRIVTGDTAESCCRRAQDAVDNYIDGDTETADGVVDSSGTWADGRSWMAHPRVRGAWIMVWLSSSDVWAFDNMLLELTPAGHWR
jgi:hypothetical protein